MELSSESGNENYIQFEEKEPIEEINDHTKSF